MPRTARIEELGLPVHVIVQGIERCAIFRDDCDRTRFLVRTELVFREMAVEVLAWALLDNHAHFVLRTTEGRLGKAMQRTLGSHAVSFNRRHERVGRLFRDRFWSRPVDGDDDLLGLIGYVVLNPLRAGIVQDLHQLRSHPWTSLAEILSPASPREPLAAIDSVLRLFGPDRARATRAMCAMIAGQFATDPQGDDARRYEPDGAAALSDRERQDLRTASVHALRLRSERIDRVLRERESATAVRLRLEHRDWTLDRVVSRAATLCRTRELHLRQGARRRHHARARSLVAHFAGMYLGCSDADIARTTGTSRKAIPRARRRFHEGRAGREIEWEEFFELSNCGDRDRDAVTEAKK